MKGSNFVFDCVQLLDQKCHKINPDCVGNIEAKFKSKIFTNKKDKYVQYAITVALNCENLSINTLKKITKTKPFTSNYN